MKKQLTLSLRSLFLSAIVGLTSLVANTQTVIIDPATDGGFEMGPTFGDNGWTTVNTTTLNGPQWFMTSAPLTNGGYSYTPTGGNAAYISSDLGATWSYQTPSAASAASHFYKDVTFPAGETAINLSFRFNASGESTWDDIHVYLCPTTLTPVMNQPSGTSTSPTWTGTGTPIFLGRFNLLSAGIGATVNVPISPATVGNCSANTTWRLVFTWKNDTGGGTNPPAAIDDISLISSTVTSPITSAGGTFTINNTLLTGGSNFNNFTDAITQLNLGGSCGFVAPLIFNVSAGQTFNELPPVITASGSLGGEITFQKSGAGSNPVISSVGTAGVNDGVLVISGGDYYTFDGIDINTSAVTDVEYGYILRASSATNGAQFNTIKNCSVMLNRNVTTSNSSAIFQTATTTGGGVTPTSAAGSNSFNKYYNLNISNAINGIYLNGNTTFRDFNTEVGTTSCLIRNTITNVGPTTSTFVSARGIYSSGQEGIKMFNNDVSNVAGNQAVTGGLYNTALYGNCEINNNTASNISVFGSATTTSIAYGVYVGLATTLTHNARVYNNVISNVYSSFTGAATTARRAIGLYVVTGTATSIYDVDNNSVSIGNGLAPTYSNTAFEIGGSTASYRVRNNIFANFTGAQTTSRHTCWATTSGTSIGAGSIANFNDLYIQNDLGVSGFTAVTLTTYRTTIANFSAAITTPAGIEANSIAVNPNFVNNNSNLHASNLAINNAGMAPQPYITADIECAARTDNDMGAYILTACSGTPTAGSISGLSTLCSGSSTLLTLNGASSEAGVNYQWASSTTPGGPYGTLLGTANTQNTGAVTAPTYYVVTVTCSVSGLSVVTAEHAITVTALPTVSVTPTTGLICLPGGASIPLTASGSALSYTWSPATGLSGTTGTNVTANPTSTTTYVVTGTDAIGCTATASSVITVASNPTITSLTATPTNVCTGGSSQLQVVAVLPSILISEVTVFRTGTGATVSYPALVVGADLVEISNISSSTIDISGYMLMAFANNLATASHMFTFPVGTTIPSNSVAVVHLGTGTNDVATRYFNTGGTSDTYSSASQIGVVLTNGSMIVDAVGLGGSLTGSYTFNAATGVTAGDWTGFAPNASGLAGSRRTASSDNNIGADWTQSGAANLQTIGTYDAIYSTPGTISYAWTPATFLDNAAISNPLASGITTTTTYTVTATSSTTCSTTGNITIVEGAILTSAASSTPGTSICAGTNVTLTSTGIGGGAPYTYAWSGPNSFTSTSQNPSLPSVSALNDGVYTVVVTDNCGATSTSTVTLTVNALPVVTVTPTTALFCSPGTAITMTGSGADTYSWSPAAGLSATTGTSVDASPSVNTTYTVTGTNLAGCTSTATATINNSVSVTMNSVTATPSTICTGNNSTLVGDAVLNSPTTYCNPSHTSGTGSGDYISSVQLNTLNNVTTGAATPYYTMYPQTGTTTTTLVAGNTYNLVLSAGTYSVNDIAGFIDFNQNGVLNDAGEKIGETDDLGSTPVSTTFTFTVPLTATNGSVRMRIRETDHGGVNDMTPCAVYSWGETEDYIITITGGVDPLTYAWTPATFLSATNTPTVTATAMTATTTYTLTATSAGGCTATGSATVSVFTPTSSTISPVACVSYTSPNGSIYTTSGTYVNVIPNAGGCDSTITINLMVNQHSSSTISPIACDSYTSPNGSIYTTSGTYTNVIPNAAGCDSTITINLTVNNSSTNTLNPVVCNSYTSPNGSVYTSTGTYTNVIPNAVGCDSTITINLLVYGATTSTISPIVCNTYTSPDGSVYTSSGTYTNTIPNYIGCDSIITINLTVNYTPNVFAGNDITVCQNGQAILSGSGAATYTWDNGITNGVSFVVLGTNTYTVVGTSSEGCSGMDMVTITAIPVPTVDAGINITQCGDQNVTLNGSGAFVYTWNNGVTNGVAFNSPFGTTSYIVTGVDTYGCSNTDIVNVTINAIPVATATAADAITIVANPANESYQWIDCATNIPFLGETSSTFTATVNGSYAVIVTGDGGCADTSTCVIIDEVGLSDINKGSLMNIHPNPTTGNVYVTLTSIDQVNVTVFDAQGKLILSIPAATNNTLIDLNNVERGVYLIHLNSSNGTNVHRVVKN